MHGQRLGAIALAAAVLCGGPSAAAQDQPPPTTEITSVTVLGKLKKRPASTVRRLDRRSASSCAYDFTAAGQDFLDDYIDAFHGRERANDGSEAEIVMEGDAPKEVAFSDSSPYGDASRNGNAGTVRGDTGGADCGRADYAAMAGRNYIMRKDKTIDRAYALYDKGDYAAALAEFKTSYRQVGWDEAALMIGDMLLRGEGAAADPKEAAAWYTKVANGRRLASHLTPYDPKNPDAANARVQAHLRLARMYLHGIGVAKDAKLARAQYAQAEEMNHIPARFMLGRLLVAGIGGPADAGKGLALITSAAEYGYAPAQWTLAHLYDDNRLVARDAAKAYAWYQQAAFNPTPGEHRPHALQAIARMLDAGDGVKADPAKALGFYKAAAVAGHPAAQNALATYFYEGTQVAQDLALARKLFIAAASQGNGEAMRNLGVMLYKGEGGSKDVVQSYVWLRLAERVGNGQATPMANAVEKRLSNEERERAAIVLKPAKG